MTRPPNERAVTGRSALAIIRKPLFRVMAGLITAIQVLLKCRKKDVHAREEQVRAA